MSGYPLLTTEQMSQPNVVYSAITAWLIAAGAADQHYDSVVFPRQGTKIAVWAAAMSVASIAYLDMLPLRACSLTPVDFERPRFVVSAAEYENLPPCGRWVQSKGTSA